MRKLYIFLFAALSMVLFSCTRQEMDLPGESHSGQYRVRASIVPESSTKTSLDASGKVLWADGDQIGVYIDGNPAPACFVLDDGAGTPDASFTGSSSGSTYVGIYPYEIAGAADGSTVSIELPARQQYATGSFESGSNPMYGQGSNGQMTFKNLCSLLKLSITGHHVVTEIVFASNNTDVKVSGPGTASAGSDGAPVLTMGSDASNSVSLVTGGVMLNDQTPTDFYLALPPQTYTGGFTVTVYTSTGSMTKTLSSSFTLKRSRIHAATPFAIQLQEGIEPSTSLPGNGTVTNPFQIATLADLLYMQSVVNAKDGTISSASGSQVPASSAAYLLTADIDLSPVCGYDSGKSWEPLGTSDNPFEGSFDGGGHTISNLYIDSTANGQAFFGYVDEANISNLCVQGDTSGSREVALVAANCQNNAVVDNCHAEGFVFGDNYIGGIVGYITQNVTVSRCINRADVWGWNYVGGIVGYVYSSSPINTCINYGTINGGYDIGGIAGSHSGNLYNCANYGSIMGTYSAIGGIIGDKNYGPLINCVNVGEVQGSESVGGIAGFARQGSGLWNNVNRGQITGETNTGGICGYLSSESSYQRVTSLRNCVNLGIIVATSEMGALCGYDEGETTYSTTVYEASEVTQSYWLYDSAKNLGVETGIGVIEGLAANIYALTDAQMKGAAYGSLYGSYNTILDALNGFAYDNLNTLAASLWGWKADETDGYPTLTGLDAMTPGSDNSIFTVTPASVELASALGGEFTVEVKATENYEVSVPSWVTKGEITGFATDPYTKVHHFSANANTGTSQRSGTIQFTNAQGKVLNVSVKQDYAYLDADATDLIFTAEGNVKRFNITSSVDWKISANATWVRIEPEYGTGDAVIGIRADENESSSARGATLTIASLDGTFSHSISITQSGKVADDGQEGNWQELPFVHQTVAMRFTATWCGWCPRMNKSIHRAQELYPDKILHLALHNGDSDLAFDSVSGLKSQYSINSFPTGVIDGRTKVGNSSIEYTSQNIVTIVQETENTYGTVTGAAITSTTSGRNASIDVDAYLKQAGSYKLTVLLVEDGIDNEQSDYEDGDHSHYTHDAVARIAVSDVLGEAFTTSKDFTVKHFSYTVTVPATYNMTNMRVFVYIQRAFGSYPVIQTDSSYGSYFIDNSATVELGRKLKLALEGAPSGGGGGNNHNEGISTGSDIIM